MKASVIPCGPAANESERRAVERLKSGLIGHPGDAEWLLLTPAVERVLTGIESIEGNPWVIAGQNRGDHLKNLDQVWQRVRTRAKLGDVRIHDARHSYASRALAIGESLPTIGRLLGHRRVTTTARYAHLAEDSVRDSAVRVSDSIAADLQV